MGVECHRQLPAFIPQKSPWRVSLETNLGPKPNPRNPKSLWTSSCQKNVAGKNWSQNGVAKTLDKHTPTRYIMIYHGILMYPKRILVLGSAESDAVDADFGKRLDSRMPQAQSSRNCWWNPPRLGKHQETVRFLWVPGSHHHSPHVFEEHQHPLDQFWRNNGS